MIRHAYSAKTLAIELSCTMAEAQEVIDRHGDLWMPHSGKRISNHKLEQLTRPGGLLFWGDGHIGETEGLGVRGQDEDKRRAVQQMGNHRTGRKRKARGVTVGKLAAQAGNLVLVHGATLEGGASSL